MLGQPEQLDQPSAAHLLDHRGRGSSRVQPGVLVPSRGEPVGGKGSREATPMTKPKNRPLGVPMIPRSAALASSATTISDDAAFGQRSA